MELLRKENQTFFINPHNGELFVKKGTKPLEPCKWFDYENTWKRVIVDSFIEKENKLQTDFIKVWSYQTPEWGWHWQAISIADLIFVWGDEEDLTEGQKAQIKDDLYG